MSEWQPIETAPKDGTIIIVWPPSYRGVTSCARFDSNKYANTPRPYWNRTDELRITESRRKPPTHWRPVLSGPGDDDEPITEEWCLANGATLIDAGECAWQVAADVRVVWDQHAECVGVDAGDHGIVALSITTRGRLRNLLAALREDDA